MFVITILSLKSIEDFKTRLQGGNVTGNTELNFSNKNKPRNDSSCFGRIIIKVHQTRNGAVI